MTLNRAVEAIQESTRAGTAFVFGFVGGGDAPYEIVSLGFQSIIAGTLATCMTGAVVGILCF